jgi:hypothetical protein
MTALAKGPKFDLILSNPPYEPEGIDRRLPATFKKEPKGSPGRRTGRPRRDPQACSPRRAKR